MSKYLDLDRRFGLLTHYMQEDLLASTILGKRLTWVKVLEGRFSVIVARANFGKTMELRERAKALQAQGKAAIFVALHRLLANDEFSETLDPKDNSAYDKWIDAPEDELTVFVDSLDEALLAREEDGLRISLRRIVSAVNWPNSDIRWVLSARPAVLTIEVLELLQKELGTTLYSSSAGEIEQ